MADLLGTDELIDQVLTDHHQIKAAKTSSVSYLPLRARVLNQAQLIVREVWVLRDWTFCYVGPVDITVAADGTFDLDTLSAVWANDGEDGGVWLVNEQRWLTWMRPGHLRNCQLTTTPAGSPEFYTVVGRTLTIWPPPMASTPAKIVFKSSAPSLSDASPGGLDLFPVDWRDHVLYQGVVAEEMRAKGDAQAYPIQQGRYERAKQDMICGESQGKPTGRDLPIHPSSIPWGWGYP